MGVYLNPGNSGFAGIRNDRYIDKSGLINLINHTINTPRRLTCISRPRRFGKSFAAKMLCAYYDKTCDSAALFDDLEIAKQNEIKNGYIDHLNQYDVIYLDMTGIMSETEKNDLIPFIKRNLTQELVEAYPELKADESFSATLVNASSFTGNKFIMIIDEWDAPIREMPEISKEYLEFLRGLFKNSGTTDRIFAAAYITGILPIKKDGSESAISDFWEYSMLEPGDYGKYVGFTEDEVRRLCEEYQMDFGEAKRWYDGYSFDQISSIYNPYSVFKAMIFRKFRSYWKMSSAADKLTDYISGNYDGLSKAIAELLGGIEIEVDISGFKNDLDSVENKDQALTLLIHLGYLSYDEEKETVHIPNEEIRLEFAKSIREVKHADTLQRVYESDRLIEDTVHMREEAVAAQIEKIHAEETSPIHYNNEQSLRSVIKLAYFSYKDHYIKFEELPAGDGYADIIYLPKKHSDLPALVIELKWNQSVEGAIAQIKEKRYPDILKDYGSDILLVGISYDKNASDDKRKHVCRIEKV